MASDCDYGSVKAPLTSESSVTITVGQKQCHNIKSNIPLTKVYTRRWLILACFVLFAASNTCHWVQYSIINNIITRYYGVSSLAVDWTSLVFMVFYLPLVLPTSYMMEKFGLRWACIIGCLITTLGTWIKVFSVSPDKFWVAFIGQALIASMQVVLLNVPCRLSASWFGSSQVSTATAMGMFGFQLGLASSFLFTPMVIRNHKNLDDIGSDLSKLYWFCAIVSTVALCAVIMLFKDQPPLPPSESQRLRGIIQSQNEEGFVPLLKRLLTNRSYLSLWHAFGLSMGILNSFGSILNQMYLKHFEGGEREAGQIGLLIVMTGVIGSISFGIILDKTHKFKLTTCILYSLTLVGQILFATSMMLEIKWMIYASSIFLGIFISGYYAVGYEMCAEFTYPEPEQVATAFLNISNLIYGTAIVLVFGRVLDRFGDFWVHVGMGLILLNGLITTLFTKDLHKRQDAKEITDYTEIPLNPST